MRTFFCFFILTSSLFAAPVGNPCTPALMQSGFLNSKNPWIKATTGYLADYVDSMRLSLVSGTADFNPEQTFHRFGLHSQMATISLGFLQRLETYAMFGGSKEHLDWNDRPQTSLFSSLFDFQTTYHFSWAVGVRVVLLQWGQTFFSLDGSYFTVPSHHKSFFKFLNRLKLPINEDEKQHFNLREWQGGVALSSRFWIFTPYAGTKYLRAKLHIQEGPETTSLNYQNTKRIGYYYGLTLNLTGNFLVAFERRVRDEFAYSFSTQAVF